MAERRTGGGGSIDPISLEIQWQRLITIMDEVDAAVVRTSFSTIVGESRDFACVMLDTNGESVAQSTFSTPVFTVTLPKTAGHLLAEYPLQTLEDGDVLITNNPWMAAGHLPDVSIVTPVFRKGVVIGFIGTVAHVSDIGGRLGYYDAHDVYEEGLCIPPMKLYRAGKENSDLFRIVQNNVRVSHMVIGDFRAIVGAQWLGAKRLNEFLDDYEMDSMADLAQTIHETSEAAMRRAIAALPDGRYPYHLTADGFAGVALELNVEITIDGDEATVDFTGSSPEFEIGAINCGLNNTFADTIYPFKCSLTPLIPNNTGLFRPVNVIAPEGTVVNTRHPSPVKARSNTDVQVHHAIYAALSSALGEHVQAGSASFWGVMANGIDSTGQRFNNHLLPDGGIGAMPIKDGLATTAFPHNKSITPAEVFENTAPMLMERRELLPDSGGAGKFRGGLGERVVIQSINDRPFHLTLRPDKIRFPPPGLEGGQPGAIGSFDIDGETFDHRGPRRVLPGQRLELRLPGGGGYGDPHERDRAAVRDDIEAGYVSPDVARSVYGYSD
ncbi:MAG: hydantoinase B/oxoprolinase family protein [Thermomicrobiales bacterium]|nr:hydantoinase B/oxoprolinase family protein [Thermomicrobiales bacterium]